MRIDPRISARGLVLLAMVIFIALTSLGIALAAEVWGKARQRERETELLFVGEQYRRAIESYWRATPGAAKKLPPSLENLLTDDRFPVPVRHLRRLYTDPITGGELTLVREQSLIAGVFSPSKDAPMKVGNFPIRYSQFEGAPSYEQWRFVFLPPRRGTPVPKRP